MYGRKYLAGPCALIPKARVLTYEDFDILDERARAKRGPPKEEDENKMLVIVGGESGDILSSVQSFDFSRERWRYIPALQLLRTGLGATEFEGSVYVMGGYDGRQVVNSVHIFDPLHETWSQGPGMLKCRERHGVVTMQGRIFAIALSSVEAFDPRAGVWTSVKPLSERKLSVGVAVLKEKLYAVGGWDRSSGECLRTVECYEPRMNCWEPAPKLIYPRGGPGVTTLKGKLYAVGGIDYPHTEIARKDGEVFDPEDSEENWKPIAEMRRSRRHPGVVAINGKVYAIGGNDGLHEVDLVEEYQPATDTWRVLRDRMLEGRSLAGVCLVEKPDWRDLDAFVREGRGRKKEFDKYKK